MLFYRVSYHTIGGSNFENLPLNKIIPYLRCSEVFPMSISFQWLGIFEQHYLLCTVHCPHLLFQVDPLSLSIGSGGRGSPIVTVPGWVARLMILQSSRESPLCRAKAFVAIIRWSIDRLLRLVQFLLSINAENFSSPLAC